jgi:transcriptional regulator with XRE-family HTH domain
MKTSNRISLILGNQTQDEKDEINTLALAQDFLVLFEQAMEEQQLTRKELAERLGTSPSFVTQLFKADRIPNLEVLAKMKDRLGIEITIQRKRPFAMKRMLAFISDEPLLQGIEESVLDERLELQLKPTKPSIETLVA